MLTPHVPGCTTDLHGLYVQEAVHKTEEAVRDAQAKGMPELRVIVGKGVHSPQHRAKIKPAIEKMMQEQNLAAELDPHNAGVVVVHLNAGRAGAGAFRNADFTADSPSRAPATRSRAPSCKLSMHHLRKNLIPCPANVRAPESGLCYAMSIVRNVQDERGAMRGKQKERTPSCRRSVAELCVADDLCDLYDRAAEEGDVVVLCCGEWGEWSKADSSRAQQ